MRNIKQKLQMANKDGFIAALDQSGGSTPKALLAYGVSAKSYKNDKEMFDQIHNMRTRIIKSPSFTGDKVIGAILFERTMNGKIDGKPTAQYLWEERGVVPFLKVDKGLFEERQGVQLMKPMLGLEALCGRAVENGIFGTKMRSNILAADPDGIALNAAQQFEVAMTILDHGLMPIIEPEININMKNKATAENLLAQILLRHLNALPSGVQVMLKLTLPEKANQYRELVEHPAVLRNVALSGGYLRDEANKRLAQNKGMIASFSRAMTEGLRAQQSDSEFNAALKENIDSIYQASRMG